MSVKTGSFFYSSQSETNAIKQSLLRKPVDISFMQWWNTTTRWHQEIVSICLINIPSCLFKGDILAKIFIEIIDVGQLSDLNFYNCLASILSIIVYHEDKTNQTETKMQRRNRKHWMWGHLDTQPEIFQLLFFAKCTINKVFQESLLWFWKYSACTSTIKSLWVLKFYNNSLLSTFYNPSFSNMNCHMAVNNWFAHIFMSAREKKL